MALRTKGFLSALLAAAAVASASGQSAPPAQGAAPTTGGSQPTFRVQVDAVTVDVIPKDARDQFVSDLAKSEFEIYEDGVKQDIVSMTLSHGGRVSNLLAAAPAPAPEGIILPPARKADDTSGRIFLFFVDDLHLQFGGTSRVRELFKKISKTLVHDGDLFGIVSSGPSSISTDMTYDRQQLEDSINHMTGGGLKPKDIIDSPSGAEGPSEVRYRAHVAFSTMIEGLQNLEKVHNRRKALVWVSEGYDFNPFQSARLGANDPSSPFAQNEAARMRHSSGGYDQSAPDPDIERQKQNEEFSDADLARELGDVTRAANRANATIYTIDPRGLVGGSDIDEQVDPTEWADYVRKSQDSMRVLADETGGYAVVNQNDFDKALKRIDNETSDYYVLGYYSSNPDPTRRRRQVEVKIARKGVTAWSRKEYTLKPLPKPAPPKP